MADKKPIGSYNAKIAEALKSGKVQKNEVPLGPSGIAKTAKTVSNVVKSVAGKASGAKAGMKSTGKMKVESYKSTPSKAYEPPVKGAGKPKYQNVIKEARVDTKATRKESIKKGQSILKPIGTKATKQEVTRKAGKEPNIAKQIDREYKEQKGVRTAKPTTPKVPVKKSGK